MDQEFLKVQDYRTLQLASFQAVGNGKRIAFRVSDFCDGGDDAEN